MKILVTFLFLAIVSLEGFAQTPTSTDVPLVTLRRKLVDGSKAYKDRKFDEAEQLFREAVACDPNGNMTEGRTARVFLARTLHSEYIGHRQDVAKAKEAIEEYKKALLADPNDQFSYKAVASLLENLQEYDEWNSWVSERSKNDVIRPENRAEALMSLATKQNTCAKDITDSRELENLRTCVSEGTVFIDQALLLENAAGVEVAKRINIRSASDAELTKNLDLLRIFELVRSYKSSLLMEAMRLAKMEGRTADRDRLKIEADDIKASSIELRKTVEAIGTELEKRASK